MSIRTDLLAYLKAQPEISAIVADRIYPVVLPEGVATPAITYRASGDHSHAIKGSAGQAWIVIDLTCWGQSYATADALQEVLRQKLQGLGGTTVVGSTLVYSTILSGEDDDYEPADDGSENGDFLIRLQYRISYAESIPTP